MQDIGGGNPLIDGGPVGLDRFGETTLIFQHQTELRVGFPATVIDGDAGFQSRDGGIVAASLLQCISKPQVQPGVGFFGREGATVNFDRFGKTLLRF